MLSATKQAISIKLATTVGHFYVTLTLTSQTFIWLVHLGFSFLLSFSPPFAWKSMIININGEQIKKKWNQMIAVRFQTEGDPPKTECAANMAGSLKTVAHAILSPYAVYLYLHIYRYGCTYRVTLRVFS